MLKSIVENKWLRQLAVFIGYGVVYTSLLPHANSVWAITCGLRMACLLLLPYRYWPTLALAEVAPLIYQNGESRDQLGLVWAIANSIPPILYAMPVVGWCRQKLQIFPSQSIVRINALFVCIVLTSVVWTAAIFMVLATVVQPHTTIGPYTFRPLDIVQIFLGRYNGVLTVVPLALVFKLSKPDSLRMGLLHLAKSQLALETVILLLPALAVLTWVRHHVSAEAQEVTLMATLLPVAWLTMKHGWRAAAIGMAAAITSIYFDVDISHNNRPLVGAQAFIAFATTSLFALGARITVQNAAQEQEHLDAKAAIKLAQQGLYQCEVRMRQAAQALEQIGGTLQLTQTRLLNRFKHMLPLTEGQNYYRQAAATQNQMYRLAESMHPMAWRERGLPAALRETIGRSLDEAGLAYRFDMKGRGLSQLSPGIHAAIYRLACEAVVYLCERQNLATIIVSLRGGFTNGQRWAVLRVQSLADSDSMGDPSQRKPDNQQLALKLGANGLNIAAMRDHARLYTGELHVRTLPSASQITALLHDASQQVRDSRKASPALELFIR
jgi:two-component system, NarL family, sensor histidine kinase FusK